MRASRTVSMACSVLLGLAVSTPNSTAVGAGRWPGGGSVPELPAPRAATPAADRYFKLPMRFEANQGQVDPEVQFVARGLGYGLFLTRSEAVLALQRPAKPAGHDADSPASDNAVVRLRFAGARPSPEVTGVEPLRGKVNYFIGDDPKRWRTNISTFAKVRYRDIYPGIDLLYYGNPQQLEFDLVVAPGVDPSVIRMDVSGADRLSLDSAGDLVLTYANERIALRRPHVYQQRGDVRRTVRSAYSLVSDHRVGFVLGDYDTSAPVVIDPTVDYSTYLGGSEGDRANSVAADDSGNAYITGFTASPDFPVMNASTCGGCLISGGDAFVARIDTTQSGSASLLYSTFLGGTASLGGEGRDIAVDQLGNAYVAGETHATDFPTVNAWQPTAGTGGGAFLTKLDGNGSLLYSTYITGNQGADGSGVAVDGLGNAYVGGTTNSTDFQTKNAYQTDAGFTDAFLVKIDTLQAGSASLKYSTLFGGSSFDDVEAIAIDPLGNAYITGATQSTDLPIVNGFQTVAGGGGRDSWMAKFDPSLAGGASLKYSTYIGGSGNENGTVRHGGIAVDAQSMAYVTGSTSSSNFQTTAGAFQGTRPGLFDAFVVKVDASLVGAPSRVYSTYLGGSGNDNGNHIFASSDGRAYVTGATSSTNFPRTACGFTKGGSTDGFVTVLDPDGSAVLFSTFIPGTQLDIGFGITADSAGTIYVAGQAQSLNFPSTPNAYQPARADATDAFLMRFRAPACTDLSLTKSDGPDPVSPGADLTYTLTISNSGPDAAPAVTVTDPLPAGATFVSASSSQGTCAELGGTVTCDLGALASGSTATVTIVVEPSASGTLLNTATVESGADDLVPGNNSATTSTVVDASTLPPDTDGDGIPDDVDPDDDNDGVLDAADAFPLDPNESVDTDGDGVGNNADTDDDGDGVPDATDAFPLDASESIDTDGDGVGNNADPDDDNDGIPDNVDPFPTVPNAAPVCSAASASPASLWPPNDKLVRISIAGVTDPDGNRVRLRITRILQDEPTRTSGDRRFEIDGFGVGTRQAYVRAERAGRGNGRVYHIGFVATDAVGASCQGEVTVEVRHDVRRRAIDDGPLYDSTTPFANKKER